MTELYETLLWRGGPPEATWPWHAARLQAGARRLGWPVPSAAQQLAFLRAQVPGGLQRVRLSLIGSDLRVTYRPPLPHELTPPAIDLHTGPRLRDPRATLVGCKHHGLQRDLAPEQIACSVAGAWSETRVASLLIGLHDGRLVTPGPDAAPLPGTTLAALRQAGVAIADALLTDASNVCWMLLLNAVRGASVVASIDGVQLATAPTELQALAVRLVQPPP